jgi:nitrate/TMAO reductase-like tetraheme cytochrome c subunit
VIILPPLRIPAASAFWSAILWALALGPPVVAQDTDDCLACHTDREKVEARFLFDRDAFAQSVHGDSDCIDCHIDLEDVEEFPHEKKLAPAECGDCHDEEIESIAAYCRAARTATAATASAEAPIRAPAHSR